MLLSVFVFVLNYGLHPIATKKMEDLSTDILSPTSSFPFPESNLFQMFGNRRGGNQQKPINIILLIAPYCHTRRFKNLMWNLKDE